MSEHNVNNNKTQNIYTSLKSCKLRYKWCIILKSFPYMLKCPLFLLILVV